MTHAIHHEAAIVIADVLAKQTFNRQWCDVDAEVGESLESQAHEIAEAIAPFLRVEGEL